MNRVIAQRYSPNLREIRAFIDTRVQNYSRMIKRMYGRIWAVY